MNFSYLFEKLQKEKFLVSTQKIFGSFNVSVAENVQKWTRYFLLFFPTRPSDEYDSTPVEKTRVHFWTFSPLSVKL